MRVFDPIYGGFDTPPFLDELLFSPEVRRLSEVRLLNTLTPSLATLGEIRRYSHTLGVIYLCLRNPHFGLSKREIHALLASVLIHDAGTPAFAHLMEYYLADKFSWNHEGILRSLLTGTSSSENTAHQLHRGLQIYFKRLCERADIDFDLVLQIANKESHLSLLLFGQLDFDNLDNVIRMAWALGINHDRSLVIRLASNVGVKPKAGLTLSRDFANDVRAWASLRRQVYDIIVFDELTVAAQAVLSRAISSAIAEGMLTIDDWKINDEQLIERLRSCPGAKDLTSRYFGVLPQKLFILQRPGTLRSLGFKDREDAAAHIEHFARERLGINNAIGYAFVDKGAFEKQLDFTDPSSNEHWSIGKRSESVIFYCFTLSSRKATKKKRLVAENQFVESLRRLKSA